MPHRTVANSWTGVYTYDPIPELPEKLHDAPFDLSLNVGWFGRFTGVIIDHPPGIPEQATIAGRISGNTIHFTKKYRSLWIVDELGKLTNLPDERSLVLHYEGQFDQHRTCISGTWKIVAEHRRISGTEWNVPTTSGRWNATISRNAK